METHTRGQPTQETARMHIMHMPKDDIAIDIGVLPELFDYYLAEKTREKELSDLTVKSYVQQIQPFLYWLSEQPTTYVTPQSFSDFTRWFRREHINQRGTTPAANTVNHSLQRIRSLLRWCYVKQCVPVDMSLWLPRPRLVAAKAYFPDIDELQRIFDTVEGANRIRNWSIFSLLLSTGARVYEMGNAIAGNVTFNSAPNDLTGSADHRGMLWLHKVKFDTSGEGEGRTVVFCNTAGLLLKVWLLVSARQPKQTIYGLTPNGISICIRRAAAAANTPRVSPHAFRRAFSDYWDSVHGLEGESVLRKQMGHKEKNVTETHYLRRNHKRVAQTIMHWHISPMEQITLDFSSYPLPERR